MTKYTLSELLNASFDKYNNLGNELIGLNDSVIEKPKHRNLQLYASTDWNYTGENSINAYWDIYGPRIDKLIDLLVHLGVIDFKEHYNLDIESDGKTIDYPEFEIKDLEKWNYYYNLLKSNEFVHNMDPFFYNNYNHGKNDERSMQLTAKYILAKKYLPLIQNRRVSSPIEIVDFKCGEPYQLKYTNIDRRKLTIDALDEFLHTFTFDDTEMNKYLSEMLGNNLGEDFDLENRIDDCIVNDKAKTLSLKLK